MSAFVRPRQTWWLPESGFPASDGGGGGACRAVRHFAFAAVRGGVPASFAASAHAPRQRGGADIAVDEGEALVKGLVVADAGEVLYLSDGEHLPPVRVFEHLFQIVSVVDVFHFGHLLFDFVLL